MKKLLTLGLTLALLTPTNAISGNCTNIHSETCYMVSWKIIHDSGKFGEITSEIVYSFGTLLHHHEKLKHVKQTADPKLLELLENNFSK